jgi:hypothetical protein
MPGGLDILRVIVRVYILRLFLISVEILCLINCVLFVGCLGLLRGFFYLGGGGCVFVCFFLNGVGLFIFLLLVVINCPRAISSSLRSTHCWAGTVALC